MAIFKQGNKYWISIYRGTDKPRKYIPTGSDDRETAIAMEAMIKTAVNGNMTRAKVIEAIDSLMGWDRVEGVILSLIWATYEKTKPTAKPHTINQRRSMCKKLIAWLAENYPSIKYIHEITPQQAYAFSDWLLETEGGKGKTHNNRISNLKTVFKAIVIRANMQDSPFDYVGKVSQDDSVSGRAFTEEEQKRIFARCALVGNDWIAICTVAKYTGLRLIDIAGLRWEQIKGDAFDITPSKTKKHGIRVRVPLHANVKKEIRLLEKSTEHIFPVLAGRYSDGQNNSKFMDEVLRHVDLGTDDARKSFHCWRHTFRTMMARADVPKEIAMKLGGWTNADTAEIYNHFEDYDALSKAINAL